MGRANMEQEVKSHVEAIQSHLALLRHQQLQEEALKLEHADLEDQLLTRAMQEAKRHTEVCELADTW